MLYGLLYGLPKVAWVVPPAVIELLAATGVLIFGLTGVVCVLNGANFLDYHALLPAPVTAQHTGIILIELGVGITVAAVIITIFYAFSAQRDAN